MRKDIQSINEAYFKSTRPVNEERGEYDERQIRKDYGIEGPEDDNDVQDDPTFKFEDEEHQNLEKAITWNTGAFYTDHGQRIAAAPFDGGSYMVDIDRGLDYFYPETPCTRAAVMDAYLHNRQGMPTMENPWQQMADLRRALEDFARKNAPLNS